MKHLLTTVLVVVASGIMLPSQKLSRGSYLVGTQGWDLLTQVDASKNTVQMVDPHTGEATRLKVTIPNNEFAAAFLINSDTSFFMGTKQSTKGAPVEGNVYLVTLQTSGPQKGTWLATRFNTRGGTDGKGRLGINVSSMVWDSTFIYVCGSGVFARSATDSQVLRILRANGKVFVHARFGAQFMPGGALGGGGAMVRIGTTLHVFTFDSREIGPGSGINQHWAISTNPLGPSPVQVGANLPPSKRFVPAPGLVMGYAASEVLIDPRSRNIIVVGRFGELLWRTPSGVNLKHVQWPGTYSGLDEAWRGCAINTDTWELALGDHNGASIDVYRDNGPLNMMALSPAPVAAAPTVNNLAKPIQPTPGIFTVAGLAYVPTSNPSVYHPVGDGCKESSGLGPWSYVNSPPTPGNKTFRLRLSTKSKTAALFIGTKRSSPLDLGPSGAPGCLVHVNPVASFRVLLRSGDGTADFPAAIPAAAKGVTLYLQWVVLDPKANKLGIALSEARMLRP